MPRMPNPPREGHPGKPPRRRKQGEAGEQPSAPARTPRSYGQSAEMPPRPASGDLIDLEPDSLEDLAGEPIREEGEDEPGNA